MIKSVEISKVISGEKSDFYSMDQNIVLKGGVKVCKIFDNYGVFNFDVSVKGVVNDLASFNEAILRPIYPIPSTLFTYEDPEILTNAEIAGTCWVNAFQFLENDAINNGEANSFEQLSRLADGYIHLYTTQRLPPPPKSQMYLRFLDIEGVRNACEKRRIALHKQELDKFIPDWREKKGADILRNFSGFEYLRYDKGTGQYETTRGIRINKSDMDMAMIKYINGETSINLKGHHFSKDEEGKEHFSEFDLPIQVMEDGNVKIDCMIMKKEEFFNAINEAK